MTEAQIQADIRKALGLMPNVRLFRNNRGQAWMGKVAHREGTTVVLINARPVEFGLTDGASDLIGLIKVAVTPDLIGRSLAVFTAGEVKRPKVAVPEHQADFLAFVRQFGGRADVLRSVDDAMRLVGVA